MTKDRPIECVVSGRIGEIVGYKDYYFKDKRVLCTRAFYTSAVATMIDYGAFPPGSTELDDATGHNHCKMPKALYEAFCHHVLGCHPIRGLSIEPKLPSATSSYMILML